MAVLFDSLDIMKQLLTNLREGSKQNLQQINTKAFVTRLNWLSEKFKDIERSSVAYKNNNDQLSQNSIDDLLKTLGL